MQRNLTSSDVYGRVHELDVETANAIATRLEARASHPLFVQVIDDYLVRLEPASLGNVLDLGCGTAIVARAVARRPDFKGTITAIDISAHLVEVGRGHASREGLAGRIEFKVGDVHSLDVGEGVFDAVIAHTLLSHVADPLTVLRQTKRLLAPEGRLVVFDGDYASLTFTTDDPDHGRASDEGIISALVAHPRIMRIMPRLLDAAGYRLVWSRAYIAADIGQADFFAPGLASFRVLLPKAGVKSEEEAKIWVDAQEEASRASRFFAASNFYSYLAM